MMKSMRLQSRGWGRVMNIVKKCIKEDCDYFKEYGECSSVCDKYLIKPVLTNFDRIRNMELDEMTTRIYKYAHNMCNYCIYGKGWKCESTLKTCVNGIKQWLESEAEDNE